MEVMQILIEGSNPSQNDGFSVEFACSPLSECVFSRNSPTSLLEGPGCLNRLVGATLRNAVP